MFGQTFMCVCGCVILVEIIFMNLYALRYARYLDIFLKALAKSMLEYAEKKKKEVKKDDKNDN